MGGHRVVGGGDLYASYRKDLTRIRCKTREGHGMGYTHGAAEDGRVDWDIDEWMVEKEGGGGGGA